MIDVVMGLGSYRSTTNDLQKVLAIICKPNEKYS